MTPTMALKLDLEQLVNKHGARLVQAERIGSHGLRISLCVGNEYSFLSSRVDRSEQRRELIDAAILEDLKQQLDMRFGAGDWNHSKA